VVATQVLNIQVDFADEQWIRHQAQQVEGEILSVDYGQCVEIALQVPEANIEALTTAFNARGIVIKSE